jgi:hypothetical protein
VTTDLTVILEGDKSLYLKRHSTDSTVTYYKLRTSEFKNRIIYKYLPETNQLYVVGLNKHNQYILEQFIGRLDAQPVICVLCGIDVIRKVYSLTVMPEFVCLADCQGTLAIFESPDWKLRTCIRSPNTKVCIKPKGSEVAYVLNLFGQVSVLRLHDLMI